LFLLRAVIGANALAESVFYFSGSGLDLKGLVAGLLLVVSGSLLLIGFWTTPASVVFLSIKVAILISKASRPVSDAIDSPWVALYAVTIAIAVALVGPGSISLDCRHFGPREIIIPPTQRES
jgi:uncharacterized membrane protein YphA (DoxX/SURF4 family)